MQKRLFKTGLLLGFFARFLCGVFVFEVSNSFDVRMVVCVVCVVCVLCYVFSGLVGQLPTSLFLL